jgi:hypothetical protein
MPLSRIIRSKKKIDLYDIKKACDERRYELSVPLQRHGAAMTPGRSAPSTGPA